jgi:cytidine deaminase
VIASMNSLRASMEAPLQSRFRVLAVLCYVQDDDPTTVRYIVGANSEPCSIGGSICAERACLVQLRLMQKPISLLRIFIVSDAPEPLAPGMLCR